MKKNLEAQYKELEEKRRVFENEKVNWEAQQRILEQQKLDASKSVLELTPDWPACHLALHDWLVS